MNSLRNVIDENTDGIHADNRQLAEADEEHSPDLVVPPGGLPEHEPVGGMVQVKRGCRVKREAQNQDHIIARINPQKPVADEKTVTMGVVGSVFGGQNQRHVKAGNDEKQAHGQMTAGEGKPADRC